MIPCRSQPPKNRRYTRCLRLGMSGVLDPKPHHCQRDFTCHLDAIDCRVVVLTILEGLGNVCACLHSGDKRRHGVLCGRDGTIPSGVSARCGARKQTSKESDHPVGDRWTLVIVPARVLQVDRVVGGIGVAVGADAGDGGRPSRGGGEPGPLGPWCGW